LTNMRVADLVRAGVSTQEIVRVIASAPEVNFDLRPASTDNLLQAGVSENIIKAMAARENGTSLAIQPVAERKRLGVAPSIPASGKFRVFIEESNDSWSGNGKGQASTHPQTVEVMKTFFQSCPALIVTKDRDKADYTVSFERESHKTIRRHNKFAAFNRSGDMVYSSSTRELGNAVRGFCAAIQ